MDRGNTTFTSRLHERVRWAQRKRHALNRRLGWGVVEHSPFSNIYHCCVQKTASQWFKALLQEYVVYQYSGLPVKAFPQVALDETADYETGIPEGIIAAHLYTNFETFSRIEKPEKHRTIFVTRDPRDIVVSFYFSTKYSHPAIAYIPAMRRDLEPLNDEEGLRYIVDRLNELGLFKAQRSWVKAENNENTKIFKYEALTDNHSDLIRDVFDYLQINIPEHKIHDLARRHSFSEKANGRKPGEENLKSHYRKGKAGDWKNHLVGGTLAHFNDVTGDLVEVLGYAE